MKIIAAMSGGVDSAVAAARAVEAGHEVIGVHLALSSNPRNIEAVRAVAARLKIHMMLVGLPMSSVFLSISGIWPMSFMKVWSKTS